MQQMIVITLVFLAALFVVWSLSGRRGRLAMLAALERVLQGPLAVLRGPLATLRRRIEQPGGCAACSASSTVHPPSVGKAP